MSWRSRPLGPRLGATALAASLAACGFEPVLEPGGAPGIGVPIDPEPPLTEAEFFYHARLEDRIGPVRGTPLALAYEVETDTVRQAITPDRVTERFLVNGLARWELSDGTGVIARGDVAGDAGYSATGSTVATAAAARDAERRLMALLADRTLTAVLAALP